MKYLIELHARFPVDISTEEEAAEERERLADGEYVDTLIQGLDTDVFTATLVAVGDDNPANELPAD